VGVIGGTVLSLISRIPMRAGDGYGGGSGGGDGYYGQYLGQGAVSGVAAVIGTSLILAAVVISLVVLRRKRVTSQESLSATSPLSPRPAADDPGPAYRQLLIADPNFDLELFDESARRIFKVVQTGWTRRDPGLTRGVMADTIWQAHKQKIAGQVERGSRNRLDSLRITGTSIQGIRLKPGRQQITVRFMVDSADYQVNDDGETISGSAEVQPWAEDWAFVRESVADDWVLDRIDQIASSAAGGAGHGPSAGDLRRGNSGD
jgi:hypothetical protein